MNFYQKIIKHWFILAIIIIFTLVIYFSYFRDGSIVSGGEGSYILDYFILIKNLGFSWFNAGTGFFSTSVNQGYPFPSLLAQLIGSQKGANFFLIVELYLFPFIAFYILSQSIGLRIFDSTIVSLIYIINPFSLKFLSSLNQWNMLALYILPSFFYIIFNFYKKPIKLFFIFGLNTLLFSFVNANPPTMAIYQVALPIFVVLILKINDEKKLLKTFLVTYGITLFSFILFNLWWILNWVYILQDSMTGYSKGFAISWLRGDEQLIPLLWRCINMIGLIPTQVDSDYDFFTNFYSSFFSKFILLIPIIVLIIFFYWIWIKKIKQTQIYYLICSVIFLVLFLMKGVKGLWGSIYEWGVMNLPLFSIFKSSIEKWGILYIFIFVLFLSLILKRLAGEKIYSYISKLLVIYLLFCLVPIVTGNLIPNYKVNNDFFASKKFVDKKEYVNFRNEINNDPIQYRLFSLPGSTNYQIALKKSSNILFTGNDPILNNINKQYLAYYNGSFTQRYFYLYDLINQPGYLNLMGIYNIKKIVINKDMYPWFGFAEKEPYPVIEQNYNKELNSTKNDVFDIYDTGKYFLPKFYIPKKIIYCPDSSQKDLLNLINSQNLDNQNIFFVTHQDRPSSIEFKNIDQAKKIATDSILTGVIQSAVSEEKLVNNANGIDQGGILFPYARWKPGSLIYPYILKKESQQIELSKNNPQDFFDNNIFYAGKRITELQYWDKNINDDTFNNIVDRYELQMSNALLSLEKISETNNNNNNDSYNYLAKSEVTLAAYEGRIKDILGGDFGEDNSRYQKVDEISGKLKQQLRNIFLNHYQNTNYIFNIQEEANYQIKVEPLPDLNNWQLNNYQPLSGEFKSISLANLTTNDSGWINLGENKLQTGKHRFYFTKTEQPNLLNKSWQKSQININMDNQDQYSVSRPIIFQEISVDSDKDYSFNMISESNSKIKLNISAVGMTQDISHFYNLNNVNNQEIINIDFDKNEDGKYHSVFHIPYGINRIKVELFFDNENIINKTVNLKDISLRKVVEPKIILSKINSSDTTTPNISFYRINPTKYIVDVTNADKSFLLNFSESFHRGWKAYISPENTNNNLPVIGKYLANTVTELESDNYFFDKNFYETWNLPFISEGNHFVANGYANSWWVTSTDTGGKSNFRLIIEYSPQKYVYFGAIVLGLVCLGGFMILVTFLLKKLVFYLKTKKYRPN